MHQRRRVLSHFGASFAMRPITIYACLGFVMSENSGTDLALYWHWPTLSISPRHRFGADESTKKPESL